MIDPDSLIYIVDDDDLVRTSLTNLCRSVDLNVQAFASTEEFIRAERPDNPGCLILDVRFPGSMPSGLDIQCKLAAAHIRIPIIFISGHSDVRMSVQAMKNGAVEFLTKPVREQELLDAIRHGLHLDRRWREQDAVLRALQSRFETLTEREREIMFLVTRGLLNKQIAAELSLSEVTVKVHRARVIQKMEAKSLADLVRMGDQLSAKGLIA